MGLDNGIIIKGKTMKGFDFLNNYYHDDITDAYSPGDYEIAYWRKCWNIRGRMFEVFKDNITAKDDYKMHLSLVDLKKVVELVLKHFLDEKNWDSEYGQSIWLWEEQIRNIADQIYKIRHFLELVEEEEIKDEDLEIYFYDSY